MNQANFVGAAPYPLRPRPAPMQARGGAAGGPVLTNTKSGRSPQLLRANGRFAQRRGGFAASREGYGLPAERQAAASPRAAHRAGRTARHTRRLATGLPSG